MEPQRYIMLHVLMMTVYTSWLNHTHILHLWNSYQMLSTFIPRMAHICPNVGKYASPKKHIWFTKSDWTSSSESHVQWFNGCFWAPQPSAQQPQRQAWARVCVGATCCHCGMAWFFEARRLMGVCICVKFFVSNLQSCTVSKHVSSFFSSPQTVFSVVITRAHIVFIKQEAMPEPQFFDQQHGMYHVTWPQQSVAFLHENPRGPGLKSLETGSEPLAPCHPLLLPPVAWSDPLLSRVILVDFYTRSAASRHVM